MKPPGILTIMVLMIVNQGLTAQQAIRIDSSRSGKVFEGIGALSAGASSRLLIDYPVEARNEILDWLFKPGYGAAFQHLKVEIGGDVNSTDGTEPAYAHSRDEFDHGSKAMFSRGYESWLMAEAHRRNPDIFLDILQWGAPGWIGNGDFFSKDNVDFIIRFIEKNREYFGLEIDYCGVWNERAFALELPRNNQWIKLLHNEIAAHNLNTRIVASDEVQALTVGHEMLKDPELLRAVDILGTHYQGGNPKRFDSQIVKETGKPVWSSEDGPWRGDWSGAKEIARKFNRNYLQFGMTKTIIWSLISSYYDVLPLPGSGIMKANTPWSGQYEVQPALWAVAHFTHFIQPGWKYLDAASGFSADSTSSYTALVSGDGREVSMIVETAAAKTDFQTGISVGGPFAGSEFYLWKSDSVNQFVPQKKIRPVKGMIRLNFQKGCIYTLTTVVHPVVQAIRPVVSYRPFPLPYRDDFENYAAEATPKYTQDQSGVFEIGEEAGNRFLRQSVPGKGIEWHFRLNPEPFTILGDTLLTDYSVSVDVRMDGPHQYGAVYGRVKKVIQTNIEPPLSYWFRVSSDGTWNLGKTTGIIRQNTINIKKSWPLLMLSFNDHTRNAIRYSYADLMGMDEQTRNIFPEMKTILSGETRPESVSQVVYRDGSYYFCRENILATGRSTVNLNQWNSLKLIMAGTRISAMLNGQPVTSVTDAEYARGLAGLGSGWHQADFDNLRIGKTE